MLCMGWTIISHGTDGDYWFSSEPILIARRWLATLDRFDQYCGGPHPNTWLNYRTFDRETGDRIDLFGWLNDDAVNRERVGDEPERAYHTIKGSLRAQILTRWAGKNSSGIESEEDAELSSQCEEIIDQQESWSLGLVRKGLIFEPELPRVVMACGAVITVPWSELEPFRSDEGRAGLAALRGEPDVQ
jgi:hypothetical protein